MVPHPCHFESILKYDDDDDGAMQAGQTTRNAGFWLARTLVGCLLDSDQFHPKVTRNGWVRFSIH